VDRYQQVFENNKKWIKEKTSGDKDFFKKTGSRPTT
jgi:hypothetical protein